MNRVSLIIAALLIGCTLTLNGQFVKSAGLKAGISMANQSHRIDIIDYTIETELIAGPVVTLFSEFYRGKHLGLQADLSYVARGSKTSVESVTVNHLKNDLITVNEGEPKVSRFNYISLSPVVRYRIRGAAVTPYLLLGPRFDYLIKYETESEYPLEEQNSFILGLSGGAGVELSMGKLGLMAELQYQPDLSPVTNQDPLLINNNCLLFSVGINFLSIR
jgi:hypothetical protein